MRLLTLLVLLACVPAVLAQAESPTGKDPQSPDPATQQPETPNPAATTSRAGVALPAVRTLVEALAKKREELNEARNAPSRFSPDGQKAVADLQSQLERLEADFDSVATGIDRSQLDLAARSTTLNQDLEELLRPLLQELKNLTEEPRELDRLKTQVAIQTRKAELATTAIDNIRALQREASSDDVRAELSTAQAQWEEIRAGAVGSRTVVQAQLDQRKRDRKSVFGSISAFIGGGFRDKGLTLLQALFAMIAVFFGLRFAANRALRLVPRRRKAEGQPFYFRLISVLSQAVIGALAVAAGLMVLYAAADWVLLGLGLVFLLGVVWTAKNTLPRLVEEIRMVLNLGPVREAERILFEGLPWRVDRLSLYSRLSNPALSGGQIRLPLRDLIGLHSRPVQEKEAWFPSSEGDWVRLSDGTRGKVLKQTPEMVQLVKLGGSRVTYRTTDFLAATPENISANFRLSVTFGVDYQHQAISTDRIPTLMHEHLTDAISAKVGADNLISLAVEFKEAGASSLDYEVIIDLSGDVAARYDALQRLTQRTLVDACNEHGWVIPFTQITMHQAG